MRNVLRRIAFGTVGAGMVVAVAAGASTAAANASVAAPHSAATAAQPAGYLQWPVVQYGDHGVRVRTVQYLLDAWGYHLVVTGQFNWATEVAVKDFQAHHWLTPDGKVGAATWPKLIITVQYGSHGPAVAAVQDQLKSAYGYKIAVDGVFGPATQAAVIAFQHRFRIQADGIVGPGTWNTLVKFDPAWA